MHKWILGLVAAGMLGGIQTSHAETKMAYWEYHFHEDEIYDTPYHVGLLSFWDTQKNVGYDIALNCVLYAGRKPRYRLGFSLDSLIAIDKSQEFLILRFEDQIIKRQVTDHSKANPKIGIVVVNKQDWDMFIDLFSIEKQYKPLVVRYSGVLDSHTVKLTWKDEKGEIVRLKEACGG